MLIAGEVRVLLVRVSAVARPTRVSVEVGKVIVPVLVIVEITGAVENVFTPVIVCAVERSCKVIVPEGRVAAVTAVVVIVKLFAPEKAIVAAGIVNVPVVVDTVNPLIVFPVSACVDARSTRVTVPEGIVATVVAADDNPKVNDAAVLVARVEPVIKVNIAEVVGAVIVTLLIVEDVVIAPFNVIVDVAPDDEPNVIAVVPPVDDVPMLIVLLVVPAPFEIPTV